MLKILLVEDEDGIASFIEKGLRAARYDVTRAEDGLKAADILENSSFDLVLLDIMLPGADGFELMRMLAPADVAVIFISALAEVSDRVKGLNLGADDYLVKPFDMAELLARMNAVLRRRNKADAVLRLSDVALDVNSRTVTRGGVRVELTAREFDLAAFFMQNPNAALFRDTIYERVWEGDFSGDTRTIDLHVMRLRKKLGWETRLETVHGIGYRLHTKDNV